MIEVRKLGELKRWDRNYRVGDVSAIVRSITQFGYNSALRVWRDNTVVAGNHALIALQTMQGNGSPAPRGIRVDGTDWLVPCVDVSHLNKSEAEAFAIADNRTQELGTNDNERLAELLAEIGQSDQALLAATGYSEDDLEALIAGIATPQFDPASIDDQGKLDEKQMTKCPECGYEWDPSR